jgi:hypothetical protein
MQYVSPVLRSDLIFIFKIEPLFIITFETPQVIYDDIFIAYKIQERYLRTQRVDRTGGSN